MSYNGSGTFVINTAGQPVVSGTVISSTAFNALTADLATGLSTAITKDGQTTPTANIPMGNNKITGLAVGTAATDAANLSQVQSTVAKLVGSVSGVDTITGTMSPTLAAYAAGQMFYFVAAGDNTGAVTLNLDGLGAKSVTRDGSVALAAGDIKSGEVVVVVYDGTRFQVVSQLNSAGNATFANVSITSALNVGGVATFSGGTANGVTYLNASKALTSGSALVFDGTNLGIGTSSPGNKLDVAGTARVSNASGNKIIQVGQSTPSANDSGSLEFQASNTQVNWAIRTNWNVAGALEFNPSSSAGGTTYTTPSMLLTASGNLGLGVTPSAWNSGGKAFEILNAGNGLFCSGANTLYMLSNAFLNSSGDFKYVASAAATRYQHQAGEHRWYNAPSGTAGNTITFTQAMTLDASGNLLVGTTSALESSNFQLSAGSGASAIPRLSVFNTAATPTSSASTRINLGFVSGAANYVATNTVLGSFAFIGQANDDSYGGASIQALVTSGGNVGRGSGHSVDMIFNTKPSNNTGALERARITSEGYFKASNAGTYANAGRYHELRTNTSADWAVTISNSAATTPQGALVYYDGASPNGTASEFLYCLDSTAQRAAIRSNGGLANYQTNDVNLSDQRVKKDVKPLGSMWDKFKAIEIVTFKYKDQTHDDDNIGVIAQQVESVAPEFIDVDGFGETPEDGVPLKTVYTTDMYHAAIKALQEAMARIEQLEAKVAALETK